MQQSKSGRFGIKKHTYLGFDWPFCRLKQIGFISIKLLVKINFMKEQSPIAIQHKVASGYFFRSSNLEHKKLTHY